MYYVAGLANLKASVSYQTIGCSQTQRRSLQRTCIVCVINSQTQWEMPCSLGNTCMH